MCLMVLSLLPAVMYRGCPPFVKPISHVGNERIAALGARKVDVDTFTVTYQPVD